MDEKTFFISNDDNIDEHRNKVSNKPLNENNLYLGHFDQDVTKIILAFCKEPHSAKEIMDYIKIADRSFLEGTILIQ